MTENEALELIEREHNLYPEDSLDSVAWGEVYETFGKLKEENKALKNRCHALSGGTMCFFCHLDCEHRSCDFRNEESETK